MSGILGQIELQRTVDPVAFARMLATLAARGPDGDGTRLFCGGRIALGHRRLAVVDRGHDAPQPISNEDQRIWLTFDGAIYNFRELRKQLEAEGHAFRSQSDAEVVLHAYEEWGDEGVQQLRGVFAFGLWDERRERLLLVRDRLGAKPLYYWAHDEGLVFASQARAILLHPRFRREIDRSALQHYFIHGYVPDDLTIWAGMNKLPASHRLALDRRGLRCERYWQVRYAPVVRNGPDAVRLVRSKLEEAVRMQLMEDTPIGVVLSGGVDASATAAVAARALERALPCFSVNLDREDASALIPDLLTLHDEPLFEPSSLALLATSRAARREGVPVILSGLGSDELFAGHPWYAQASGHRSWPWSHLAWGRSHNQQDLLAMHLARRSPLEGRSVAELLRDALPFDALRRFRGFDRPSLPTLTRLQLIDLQTSLSGGSLPAVDRIGAAAGIEVRLPFLDHEFVRAVFSIESRALLVEGEAQALLKLAAASWLLPEMLIDRRAEFDARLANWMGECLHESARVLLPEGVLTSRGLLRREAIEEALSTRRTRMIGLLLGAELWARRWVEPSCPCVSELPAATGSPP